MDSGDRAATGPPAKRESDALNTWLARERHAWWRRWKWAVYIAFLITGLRMLWSFSLTMHLMWYASLGDKSTPLVKSAVHYAAVTMRTASRINWALPELMLLLALLFAFTFIKQLGMPSELALSQSRKHLYNWQLSTTRHVFWTWIGLLTIAPYLLEVLLFLIYWVLPAWTSPSSDPGVLLNVTCPTAVYFAWLTIYCVVAEWGVLFTVMPLSLANKWLWVVVAPALVLFAVDKSIEEYERYWTLSWLEAGRYDFSGRNWTILLISSAVTLLGIVTLIMLWRRNNRMPADYTGASE